MLEELGLGELAKSSLLGGSAELAESAVVVPLTELFGDLVLRRRFSHLSGQIRASNWSCVFVG